MGFCSIFCRRGSDHKAAGKKQPTWRVFSLKELRDATNNFNDDNTLGESPYAVVYRGRLQDGSQIAVKKLKFWAIKGADIEFAYEVADMEFAHEVNTMARLRHKNLVGLRGHCAKGKERFIVYDYMPNLSLHSHLRRQNSAECPLDWKRRMNIAIGCAEGIAYLHHQATPYIIHGHIRPCHVLLDSDFQVQLAGIKFTRWIPDGATSFESLAGGDLGYHAPEPRMLRRVSKSSDVYSFGILLLELATGREPIEVLDANIISLLITDFEKKFSEFADPKLNGKYVQEELKRVLLVAIICCQDIPEKRPTMPEVVELLKGKSKGKLSELQNHELFKNPPAITMMGLRLLKAVQSSSQK